MLKSGNSLARRDTSSSQQTTTHWKCCDLRFMATEPTVGSASWGAGGQYAPHFLSLCWIPLQLGLALFVRDCIVHIYNLLSRKCSWDSKVVY